MTETEKLRKKIARMILEADIYRRPLPLSRWDELAAQILQACKEAGLRFVPELDYLIQYQNELRLVGNDLSRGAKAKLRRLNSQVKEIEI